MKAINKYFLSAMVIAFLIINTATFAQVGIGTTGDPDASSMLEIQSTSKGVLIPRMLTSERTAITSPANGLLVFDTETKSFWFRDGSTWKELASGGKLEDADGDTRVEVEKVPDTGTDGDEINFTTRGTERMKIGNDGEILMGVNLASQTTTTTFQIDPSGIIKLGNRAASTIPDSDTASEQNYTKITADGSLSYVGNATRWDDLKVPVNSVKIKNMLTEPTWRDFLGNTALLWFENGDDVVFTVQMPHAWKEGSRIYPHVHWVTETNAGSNVSWALEYTWSNPGAGFPATSTITGNVPGVGSGDAYVHNITPLGTDGISGKDASDNNHTLSSMLVCRLYRGSDSYSGDAGLLEIDFHYQIDSDGSNTEYGKTN